MDAFTITVSLMFKQRKENIFSNITLSKHRDELLPLLMNGQVSLNSDLSAKMNVFMLIILKRGHKLTVFSQKSVPLQQKLQLNKRALYEI